MEGAEGLKGLVITGVVIGGGVPVIVPLESAGYEFKFFSLHLRFKSNKINLLMRAKIAKNIFIEKI